jgi:hypothetical protein
MNHELRKNELRKHEKSDSVFQILDSIDKLDTKFAKLNDSLNDISNDVTKILSAIKISRDPEIILAFRHSRLNELAKIILVSRSKFITAFKHVRRFISDRDRIVENFNNQS